MRGPTLPAELTEANYERLNSDEIVVRVRNKPAGVLRVMESFDPGWEVEVNNLPAKVLLADDAFLAVALPPGDSIVNLRYYTPGATAGRLISAAALLGLLALLWTLRPEAPPEDDEDEEESESDNDATPQPQTTQP